MHCTSRLWEEAWYFHDIINMIFTSCFNSFKSFIYIACVSLFYIKFSYSWVVQSQGKFSFVSLFKLKLLISGPARILVHSMYWCQLACIVLWCRRRYPGSAFCTPLIQLSTLESVVSLLAFRGLSYFVLLVLFIRVLRGLSQHPSKYFRGFIDSHSVSFESLIYVCM